MGKTDDKLVDEHIPSPPQAEKGVLERVWSAVRRGSAALFFVALVIGATVGAMRIGIKKDPERYDELFKFCLTLVGVGGIGGIATLMLERYKRDRAYEQAQIEKEDAKRQRVDEQCRQMFFEARKAYDTLKRTRRLLQDTLKPKHPEPKAIEAFLKDADSETVKSLVAHGVVLFDPQLLLESLYEQAQFSRDLPRATRLACRFRIMEKHANRVSDALRATPKLDEKDLIAIAKFLKVKTFRQHFTLPYHQAIEILLNRRMEGEGSQDAGPRRGHSDQKRAGGKQH